LSLGKTLRQGREGARSSFETVGKRIRSLIHRFVLSGIRRRSIAPAVA
jgi:hypothetical protein